MKPEVQQLLTLRYPSSEISFFDFGISTVKFRVDNSLIRVHSDIEVHANESLVLQMLGRKVSSFQLQGESSIFYCLKIDWIIGHVLPSLDHILEIWNDWKLNTAGLSLDRTHKDLVTNFFSSYTGSLRPLIDSLLNNWPISPSQLIHGDFHRENIIQTETDFVLIDFEFVCVGDPLFDLLYCLVYDLILFMYDTNSSENGFELFESRYRELLNQIDHDTEHEKIWITLSFLINAVWFSYSNDPLGEFIGQIMQDFDYYY
ncbi:MAG: aminoglycoside phosphotransferase family protein [Candidatus Kariarchaeaceae archaeon]